VRDAAQVRLDDALRGRLRVAVIHAGPVVAGAARPDLQAAIEELSAALRRRHGRRAPGEIEGLRPARELYRAFGIDPTRTRPSSEALLRRVLRGDDVPAIAAPVDLSNLLGLELLLPNGLYDADLVTGGAIVRRGREGEAYDGIRKGEVHLDGRPVVADDRGPFGNPTSDSARTAVTPATRRLLMVVFAPASADDPTMRRHLSTARRRIAEHLAPEGREVVTSGRVLG